MAERTFRRRTYRGVLDLWVDVAYIAGRRSLVRRAMRQHLSPSFRERLMVMVTGVNGCRYCSYYHARAALKSGVSSAEFRDLLAGSIPADTPAEEYVALLYAQHWAESDAAPDPEATQRLVETYGEDRSAAIEIVLRMIRVGNLLGNSVDYVLYLLSGGRLGLQESDSHDSP